MLHKDTKKNGFVQLRSPNVVEVILNDDLEFWMTRLPATLKNVPIIHLAIPGSHDTMTYTLERRSEVGPDEPAYIRALGHYFSLFSKPIIFNWSVTQSNDVKRQLDGGIRYLDLRVATRERDNDIYFLHGLYGSEVTKPLQDVARWLSRHTNEIVILDFQHFYSFSESTHARLVAIIHRLFRDKLCPAFANFAHISLRWLALEKFQVIVIYRDTYARHHASLWPSELWPTPWPNTVRVDKMLDFLDEKLQARSLEIGFVSQCVLTPDVSYVLKHLCGTLDNTLVSRCRKSTIPWIEEKQPGRGGLNIVVADFIAHDNYLFSRTVIQANARLLKALQMS